MLFRLARSARQYTWAAIMSPLCMIGEVYMEVRIPGIIAKIVDMGIEVGNMSVVWQQGLMLVLSALPMATAEFSKFAGILSAALSQHHLSGFEIAQLEFHHLH